jgi:hypothetical protein
MPPRSQQRSTSGKTKWDAIMDEAVRLDALSPPYSQSNRTGNPGYDCSSACAQLMRAAGYNVPFFWTGIAPDYMKTGKDPTGRLTFWNDINTHMFAEIDGQFWGTSVGNGGAGGLGWHPDPSAGYLSGFQPYHIEGLNDPAGTPLTPEGGEGSAGAGGGGLGGTLDERTAKAAAFATYFNIEGLFDTANSILLKGDKSLMNDKPLFPLVEQLTSASMRRFQSMPNGNFYAFYPDYFGGSKHRRPYWEVRDIEIVDGQIELSDDSLSTHVFVVGDTVGAFDGVNDWDMDQTAGVINIFNAFQADFISGHGDQQRPGPINKGKADVGEGPQSSRMIDHDEAVAFLKKYGARPYFEEAPMVRSAFYEAFLAYQKFCLLWAQQFSSQFQLTFMPEIFPGGLVAFPDHKLQMFVEEVTHSFDYSTGFRTDVTFSSPASLDGKGKEHEGMIRAGSLDTSREN